MSRRTAQRGGEGGLEQIKAELEKMREEEEGGGSSSTDSESSGGTTVQRVEGGKFAKGNTLGGRMPKQVDNREYIAAIKASFPPDRIVEMMGMAMDLAARTNSWRGMVAVMEFAANYTLGKPKPQAGSGDGGGLAAILAGIDSSKPLLPGTGDAGSNDNDDKGDNDGAIARIPDEVYGLKTTNGKAGTNGDENGRHE